MSTAPDDHRDQQRALYGVPLSERFGAVMDTYGLSQRALAGVLGLSAPMLSQLISAQRIKIGNPAVYQRLVMLEERREEADQAAVLQQVQESDPVLTTGISRAQQADPSRSGQSGAGVSAGSPSAFPPTLASQLALVGTAEQLRAVAATAQAVNAPELAALLEAAAQEDCRA